MYEFDEDMEIGTNGSIQYQFVDDGNLVIVRENGIWNEAMWCSQDGFLWKGVDYIWEDFEDAYLEDGMVEV